MDAKRVKELLAKSGNNLFEVAVEMADGDDAEITEIAREFRESPSKYYGLRIGGKCWLKFKDAYGDGTADQYRDSLSISFWIAAGRKVEAGVFDLEDVMDWFKDALDNDWNVQRFRNELHIATGGANFDFLKEAVRVEKRYFQFPSLGATQEQVKEIQRAAHLLYDALLAASGVAK